MQEHLRGMLAAVHTPFNADGSLNLDCVELQAEHLVRQGVIGSFVGGSTGECLSLTVSERMQLAERWSAVAKRSLRLIIHVGHNCLADAQELAAHAGKIGADGIAVVAPNYFRPATVEDLVDFCRLVAAAAPDVPFYYYHIPRLTQVNFPVADFLSQAADRISNLNGVKYTDNDLVDFGNCVMLHDGRWEMIYGLEQMLLSALVLGAQAAIGTTLNYLGSNVGKVFSAWEKGDLPAARLALHWVRNAITLIHSKGVLTSSKAMMSLLGIDCGPVRPPLRSLSVTEVSELRAKLEANGILQQIMSASSPANSRQLAGRDSAR